MFIFDVVNINRYSFINFYMNTCIIYSKFYPNFNKLQTFRLYINLFPA